MGNEMGSEDLIDCQEGSREFPIFQVGMGIKMRLCESLMNSELSLDQPEELTEEDQESILMIGGIQIFLPLSPVEVRACVAEAAERQPAETVNEEGGLEQMLEASQAEEGDEHSEEWLKIFSQEAEKEKTAALELAAEEAKEETDNMSFVDLCEEIEALERRVIVQGMHIQQVKLETGEGEYQPKE
jgi:hypothetical protein